MKDANGFENKESENETDFENSGECEKTPEEKEKDRKEAASAMKDFTSAMKEMLDAARLALDAEKEARAKKEDKENVENEEKEKTKNEEKERSAGSENVDKSGIEENVNEISGIKKEKEEEISGIENAENTESGKSDKIKNFGELSITDFINKSDEELDKLAEDFVLSLFGISPEDKENLDKMNDQNAVDQKTEATGTEKNDAGTIFGKMIIEKTNETQDENTNADEQNPDELESLKAFESILKMAADAASGKEPTEEEVSDLIENILNLSTDEAIYEKIPAGVFENDRFSITIPGDGWCFIKGESSNEEDTYSFFRGEKISDILTNESMAISFYERESETDCLKEISEKVDEKKKTGEEMTWITVDDVLFREFGTDKKLWIGAIENKLVMMNSEKLSDELLTMIESMTFKKL